MRIFPILVATLLALTMVPLAGAETTDDCPDQRDTNAVSVGDRYFVSASPGHPLQQVVLRVHGESNGLPGLQTWWTICDPDAAPIPPDRLMASVGGPIPM